MAWLRRPSPLALRIYALGLLQFAIVALALELSRQALRLPPFGEKQARYAAQDIARVYDDPKKLEEETQRVAQVLVWTVDVYGPDGKLVVHGSPPAGSEAHRFPRASVPIQLADGRTARLEYEVHPPGPPPGLSFTKTFALILIVVGAASFLVLRSITRPLGHLSEITRSFGAGKLNVRMHLKRKDEIGDVASAFDDMADRIAKLLLAERELLANVSHELRTPLARIRVALDIANEGDAELARETLVDIAQDLAELERIVDDVLTSARLALDATAPASKPTLPMRAEHQDMNVLLERSVGKFRAAHPDRPLEVAIAGDLPPVMADAVLLRRVVDNLLDNAHKYSDDPAAPIKLDAKKEKDEIVVEVRDRGVGIAKADLDRLFEPFFRADRSRTRATGGLGLGLALARRVVEAHQGTITFESEVGKGTVARVRLPVQFE